MLLNYQYASPSTCALEGNQFLLNLSTDLIRKEKVSFAGKLKHPLIFRDALLFLRKIVISDTRQKKKERAEYFKWLEQEIQRRVIQHQNYLPEKQNEISQEMEILQKEITQINEKILDLSQTRKELKQYIDNLDTWKEYNKLEKKFWTYIRDRDYSLWLILDPVITVHPDQVSFEAFSLDESIYGCVSIPMDEFELLIEPSLGTTNIDFSMDLAREIERFRTYNDVELSINPEGLTIETEVTPEYIEKKIDLPETWIKGFNQVSSAASIKGIDFELSPVDIYDICSFLRHHKADKSPRYMKWILDPNQRIKIIFEPWGKVLELKSIYKGKNKREEKVWGRRRWLILEKLAPITKIFEIRLLGFGLPQFIVADLGTMKITIGFSSWSKNDWVKGTAFNIMAGLIGDENEEIYSLLKTHRYLSMREINELMKNENEDDNKAAIGGLLRRGEAYYDLINGKYRFRQLLNTPMPQSLYKRTELENQVLDLLENASLIFSIKKTQNLEINSSYHNVDSEDVFSQIKFDSDGQIKELKCKCQEFKKGSRNISSPCSHLLTLFITSSKFINLPLKIEQEYELNELEGILSHE